MRRFAVVAVLAVVLVSTAQSSVRPNTPIDPCAVQRVSARAFGDWSERVWKLIRWERGKPKRKTIQAQRAKLACAAGPGHRRAIKAKWRAGQRVYYRHRRAMLATRCGSPECNIALGWQIASKRGISRSEFDGCLVPLWSKESGWDEQIWNTAGSGAGGIPQALPASKMGADASPSIGGWKVAAAQIKWGLDYLADRYGGPCGGWSHSQAVGWY